MSSEIAACECGHQVACGPCDASLACMMVLALMDKAHTHVLGLIDTLFLVYAGANVMAKPKTLTEPQPQPTTSKEEP